MIREPFRERIGRATTLQDYRCGRLVARFLASRSTVLLSMDPVRESQVVAPSADELEAIFRSVGDGITVAGPGGELVYANDAAARLCGLSSGEELLPLCGTELLERFEIIGEDGSPLPLDKLPNRHAS